MQYYFENIKNRLKKASVSSKNFLVVKNEEKDIKKIVLNTFNNEFYRLEKFFLFTRSKFLFKFLFFFSKNFFDARLKKKNLMIFVKIFKYLDFFFFNNKNFFFKTFFSKKNKELLQLDNFFFTIKFINLKKSLSRLMDKKKTFYKKNIWVKKKRFRKKNILIFNKLFSKRYTHDRFNNFIVDSLIFSINLKNKYDKKKLKKRLFRLLRRKYYYLFIHKKYIINKRRKFRTPFLLNLYYFSLKNKINYVYKKKKKVFLRRRRKYWRQIYSIKKRFFSFSPSLFFSFNSKAVDFSRKFLFKKKGSEIRRILRNYLATFGLFLANKHWKDKKFLNKFVSRRRRCRRSKNILYFFRWKPKIYYLSSFCFLNKQKKIKNFLFKLFWYRLFAKKTIWKNRKLQRKFFIFFFKYFFVWKSFSFFNLNLKFKFFFTNLKRRRRLFKIKKRRLIFFNKKRKKRFLKGRIKKKILRFFIILLLSRFMRKHINLEKFLILNYSFFYKNLKKINTFFNYSIFLGQHLFYFNKGIFWNTNFFLNKSKELKLISLINKK